MIAEVLVLRLLHILGGIFWLGSGLFTAFFLAPALGQVGPAAGQVMGALQQRRLFTVLPVAAILTIFSGLRLFQIMSGGSTSQYAASPMGQTFLWSGAAAIVAFFLSLIVSRPAMARVAQLTASMATAPDADRAARAAEIDRLRRRGGRASAAAMVLLIAAAVGMAIARYLV